MPKEIYEPSTTPRWLATELLGYDDELSEFNDHCAFLCDAFAAIAARCDNLDESTIAGLSEHAQWLKQRTAASKARFQRIRQRAQIQEDGPTGTDNGRY
jgi:hypothetical protein